MAFTEQIKCRFNRNYNRLIHNYHQFLLNIAHTQMHMHKYKNKLSILILSIFNIYFHFDSDPAIELIHDNGTKNHKCANYHKLIILS